MTAIIISILCALGIGGGVMLASSGGSSSGGTAVVGPVNPGGSGGSGGGSGPSTPSANSSSIANIKSRINFNGNTPIQTGSVLAAAPASAVLVSKTGNTKLQNGRLTMDINAFAPVLINQATNTYATNETYSSMVSGNKKFMSGYKPGTPNISATFDLTNIVSNYYRADAYNGSVNSNLTLPNIDFYYIKYDGNNLLDNFKNMEWKMLSAKLYLGGKRLGLSKSDFGYIAWRSVFTHSDLDPRRGDRKGVESLYIFDSSRQLLPSEYNRYGNTANFRGNITGQEITMASCGSNRSYFVFGDINITLNFNSKTLSGALSNMVYTEHITENPFGKNPTFEGIINTSQNEPNFKITAISDGLSPLNSDGSFGEGVIVKGDSIAKDELVGELSFAFNTATADYAIVNLAFGAIKK